MYFLFIQPICFILFVFLHKNIVCSIPMTLENKSFKRYFKNNGLYTFEDIFIHGSALFILSPIFLPGLLFHFLENRKRLIYSWKIKSKVGCGFSHRTIYGYKGNIYVCYGSGPLGENPEGVIKRIKKKYGNSVFAEQYINAVKEVTQ